MYRASGRYGEASPLMKRGMAMAEQVLGPEHPALANGFNELALVYMAQGQYREAEPLLKRWHAGSRWFVVSWHRGFRL